MSYPAITLYELAGTQYADLLRDRSGQRIRLVAADHEYKRSWLGCVFDTIAAFRHHHRQVTARRSRRNLWLLHA